MQFIFPTKGYSVTGSCRYIFHV